MYGVYDLQNNEICVGIFDNRKDLADFFRKNSYNNRKYNK